MHRHLLLAGLVLAALVPLRAGASTCFAFAERAPGPRLAQIGGVTAASEIVTIDYVGHSTFRIESPQGIAILTDYFGATGPGGPPDIATMNHAHETHYTDFPDPAIRHVLRGWNPTGTGPAEHHLEVGDVVVRNVTTDIRGWNLPEKDGNSIFVFEIADLCIAHLGHLHHALDDSHYARLGVIDIVMAPVDGTFTLPIDTMVTVLKRLRARIVLPMHAFSPYSMQRFLQGMGDAFRAEVPETTTIAVSHDTLPSQPTVVVLRSAFAPSLED